MNSLKQLRVELAYWKDVAMKTIGKDPALHKKAMQKIKKYKKILREEFGSE